MRALLGARGSPEAILRIRAQFGLDEPLWTQYLFFIKNLFHGEMGKSVLYKVDVLGLIIGRIEPTIFLVTGSVLVALLITIPLASIAATNRGRLIDHTIRLLSTIGLGLPSFWLAIMLIIIFSIQLDWLPVAGYGKTFGDKLHHMVLPCLTVALALSAILTRNLRASLLVELQSDQVAAARARGLPESAVFWRHAMPNSLIPTLNLLAVNIGWLISGTVIIESVFAIPGMGQLLVRGIFTRDYMVVQGVTMTFACATVLVNFLADLLTVAIDPRVKM